MNQINQKTSIPLAWAASICVALVGVVFNAGMAHSRFNALQDKVLASQVLNQANDKSNQQRDLKLQRLDITLSTIDKRLESIDRKLDKLDNRSERK